MVLCLKSYGQAEGQSLGRQLTTCFKTAPFIRFVVLGKFPRNVKETFDALLSRGLGGYRGQRAFFACLDVKCAFKFDF